MVTGPTFLIGLAPRRLLPQNRPPPAPRCCPKTARQRGQIHICAATVAHVRNWGECYYLRMNADSSQDRLADDQIGLVVEVFRMLADGTRIQLLWALRDRELSVTELADVVGKPAPSVSQHLAKLRMARLVRTRRSGTTIYYSVENEHVRQLVVDAVYNAEHAGPGVPPHHAAEALRAVREGELS